MCPILFDVLKRKAKMNQLEDFGSHNLARKIGKKMHRFKEMNGIDSPKEKNMFSLDSSKKARLTVTSRSKNYLCRNCL